MPSFTFLYHYMLLLTIVKQFSNLDKKEIDVTLLAAISL